jgi:predicted permease
VPHVVVGVMPSEFHYPGRETQLWTLLQFSARALSDRTDNYLNVVGRLRDGISPEQAQSDMARVGLVLRQQYPKENEETTLRIDPISDLISERSRLLILALCGAAFCILVLACANLANLLLAKAVSRERELAVRAALGAGRERLARQLVTESSVLGVAGGAIGILVAMGSLPLMARVVPSSLPLGGEPVVDLRIMAFATLLTAVTSIAFGVLPALRIGRRAAFTALRDGRAAAGGRQRLRAALVTVQLTASLVLLVSSGHLLRAMWRVQSVDPGFVPAELLALRTALPPPKYAVVAQREAFYRGVLDRVRALPGVVDAAYASHLPMVAPRGSIWPVTVAGEEVLTRDFATSAGLRYVTPRFFSTMRIPMRRGRDVEDSDDRTRPYVAVVSESFTKRYWPNENPIGKRFKIASTERTVVGVVGDVRVRGLERESEPQVYIPYKQVADSAFLGYMPKELVIRSSLAASSVLPSVREAVRSADPEQPISEVRAMTQVVSGETASRREQLRVLGLLGMIALLLASVGLHGLVSFTVARRTPEIGVRLALGARPGSILRMVVREGIVLAFVGVIPGLALSYAAARGMQALLVGVEPMDPPTLVLAVGLCCAVTVISSLRPAIRAAGIDPVSAMRAE